MKRNTMLAAQMYTVRAFTQTPEGIRESLKKVADIGYKAVQMSAWGPIAPELLAEYANETNLEICVTHIGFDRIVNDTEKLIAEHKIWDCDYIGLGAMPEEYRYTEEGFRAFAKAMAEPAKKIRDAGLHLVYHNHNFEMAKFNGKTGLEILMDETDPETFQFEMDTYWVAAGGGDPADWIRRLGGRMDIVHFKDMVYDPEKKAATFAEIGQGNHNWREILKACGEIGAKYHIVEQDTCKGDPFDSLRISFEYLTKLGLR